MKENYPKRLIEVDLPIKKISEHARREKSIRHGHISTLHIWWARRPLAACRAVICAALWPDPGDTNCPERFKTEAARVMKAFRDKRGGKQWNWSDGIELRQALLDFIADFANWDNSTNKNYLEASRALTQVAHESLGGEPGTRPLVVDPFAGGGAIPLEALRIGADAFASDLNPVAVLLNKVALEYIPKYGQRLVDEVRKWGEWIKKEAEKELAGFYPLESNGSKPIGFLWARTIICEGPKCGVEVPIIKNQVISSRKNAEAAIVICYEKKQLHTKLVFGNDALQITGGTSKRSSVTCPSCGYTISRKNVEAQANNHGFGFHMFAICARKSDGSRSYRQPTKKDLDLINSADRALEKWENTEFGKIRSIPEEELPYLRSIFNVRVYGINQWKKIFYRRQLLSTLIFTKSVRIIATEIKRLISDRMFANAIINCLALSVSNSFQYQCNIATYLTEGIKSAFIQGQSLPMKMDFIEANPLMDDLAGSYSYSLSQHLSGLEYLALYTYQPGTAQQVSALKNIFPEDSVDLLATDPPYYDVVPYADCSDFFYVWLRRMLHDLTDLPTDMQLTPKDDEIVQLAERNERYRTRTKHWFEDKMRDSLANSRVSVKSNGLAIIVFAHKDTSAWEALLQSVLAAGWIITGSWPIDTEKSTRLRANDSAVLASSIHLVCRPRENTDGSLREEIGDWREVLAKLPKRIHEWMPRLAKEGIVGADAIFACLGPALEIYSQFSKVEKASGEVVTLKEYLEHVWAAVAKEALNMIFEGADTSSFEEDARLTAMWLWTLSTAKNGNGNEKQSRLVPDDAEEMQEYKGKYQKSAKANLSGYFLEYDAARKIAQGLGVHLEKLQTLIEIKGDKARLLPVDERTKALFGKADADATVKKRKKKLPQKQFDFMKEFEEVEKSSTLGEKHVAQLGNTTLDRLHQAMILFAAGRGEALKRFLVEEGFGRDERFWRLAQAFSALYPKNSDEKRWVDGVMARKKGLGF